jgi:hypothetical protein
MVNVALKRPTRSYTTASTSLPSSAVVDGVYDVSERFFTTSDDGPVVVPASASASRSSTVDGGKFLSSLSLAGATARSGWEDSLDQSGVYCRVDLVAKETSKATTHGLDTVEKRRAAGFREYEGDTIGSCKQWCEEFAGCLGISYKSGGPSYPCVLVTLSSWPCSQELAGWSTHWYVTIDSFDAVGKKSRSHHFFFFFVLLFPSLLRSFLLPALPFLFPAGTALPLNATAFTPFNQVATWTLEF